MWIFCKSGFFSAVQHAKRRDIIHLRARFKGDLERLFKTYGIKSKIVHTPENDYAYRANIKGDVWARIVCAEAANINYTNFKNAVHDGTERDTAYMSVWLAMRRCQDDAEHGNPRTSAFDGPEGGHWNI